MISALSRALVHFCVSLLFLVVAWADYVTGIEIRAFPLYYFPLMLSAWYLGRNITLAYAVLASAIWAGVMYVSGREYSSTYIWLINFFTQGSAFMLVSLLVAGLRDTMKKERILSRTDSLTGLPNRRSFFERSGTVMQTCRRHKHPMTVGYLDLDNFKRANDLYGHEYGDEILQSVARTFRECLRDTDLCARMGGDEFVLMMPETDVDHAQPILERIRVSLASNDKFSKSGVTASIGAVTYRSIPEVIDDMIASADGLMYRVKCDGKNQVHIEYIQTPDQLILLNQTGKAHFREKPRC